MLIVALCQTKGGSGKSTLAECLAIEAAKAETVTLLDLDPQSTVAKWWRRRGGPPNPMLESTEGLAAYLASLRKAGQGKAPGVLIIDTPGSFLGVIREAVAESHCIVVPVSPSINDWEAMETLESILDRANAKPRTLYVVNRYRGNTETSRAALAGLQQRALVPPLTLALRTDHERAASHGFTAAEMNREVGREVSDIWEAVREVATSCARA